MLPMTNNNGSLVCLIISKAVNKTNKYFGKPMDPHDFHHQVLHSNYLTFVNLPMTVHTRIAIFFNTADTHLISLLFVAQVPPTCSFLL